MANKRIKKKRVKQAQNKKLVNKGIPQNRIKKMSNHKRKTELAKIHKNEQREILRQKKRDILKSYGIDSNIISQFKLYDKSIDYITDVNNIKLWKRQTAEIKRQRTLERKKARNFERLLPFYDESEIKKSWLTRNDDFIQQLIENKVFYARDYLGIVYAEINGHQIAYNTNALSQYSLSDIIDNIEFIYNQSIDNLDGSDSMNGVFQIIHGSKKQVQQWANGMEQRGYNLKLGKFTRDPYTTLCIRNDWSIREFSECMLLVLSNCINADVPALILDFYDFVDFNKLPFDMIFENIK